MKQTYTVLRFYRTKQTPPCTAIPDEKNFFDCDS